MPSTVTESLIFRDMFGTAEMRSVFSDEALVRRYLDVEVALAAAEAAAGVIPAEAAEAIAAAAASMLIDFDRLRHQTEITGYPILAIVHQLSEAAGPAGGFVHWGATTQDIMDTATVLQVRAALDLVGADLVALRDILAALALKHRDTPMAGRTHLQQALPITFGYKVAVWLSMVERHIERLQQMRPRVLLGQFAGAAGTLASLGADGLKVQAAFCERLDLAQPSATWHVARDGLAEVVAFLGLVTGSLGKIGTDVMLLMTTEFAEVAEPFVKGRGGSSTMPQKRNPISSELMLAAAKTVRQHVALMLDGMVQDLERATGPWHVEWIAIPESFILTGGALAQAKFMLGGLSVDTDRMRSNLALSGGLIVAEAVMMAAAPKLGRQHAHDVVYDACRVALTEKKTLAEVLIEQPVIVDALGGAEAIRHHCDPANYLGLAPQMVDHMLSLLPGKPGAR
ncbi:MULTISPECIES: 3-carboxy-cis,cis-muconate cycloisomerase [Rhodopseudomonas]|uniref:3-carboxy-cis,cis-muconate cycloisomerase n=1 Tax=Rhodopseudomonas palustris TaxID=1076 RepID=A0A0D7EHF3_RHOPL|nr:MULTISPECIES: 3-carboxy-cis,cis-muconate cycloisomerase [Rhodopseudomonas]KIZ39935.1 3-carboxy-cis,cis-muconate cycloisomerase [Rhodopseudomonas palustris]MDF3810961.1 3-carboxy-cis,cis-muconate cycloisomerase [Rhodopseudomonas sp. BAL398]WOK16918.1 3-carboxy-cis,cis-muconate cycloisomerase [Rhodopseudomonas sp. BAL398]